MTEPGPGLTCPDCGASLRRATLGGLCPRCVTRRTLFDAVEPPPAMPSSLRVLGKFGDYELIEEIARGGMGVVYRARQLSLGRVVAVKLMRDGALATEQDVQRFHAEAEAAASLQHPGIVAIYEVGDHEGQHYFSMEFIAGRSLAELTRDGPLPARQAAQCLASVAEAVQHAHDRGVLHRDLKPSNVIVDTAGQPHVTDFGLAKRLHPAGQEGLTLTGQVFGTPGYMAPEQAAGRHRDIAPASDVYSLGALVYHVLTGLAPFTGETPAIVLRQIEERDPIGPRLVNPSIPADLETICLKALAKEPPRRYVSASDLAEDLRRWLRGEPIHARPTGQIERAWRWCRRNRALATLALATLVLLVAVAAGSLVAARRIELSRRAEASGRAEAEGRLRQGERLLDFLLGDLYVHLEPVGRLDVLEGTIAEVERFYAGLSTNRPSPEAMRHHARAQLLLGRIRGSQGRLPEARASFESALRLYKDATDAQPTNTPWIEEHSQAWNSLAVWEHYNRQSAAAEAAYLEALSRTSRLIREHPENSGWIDSHASILHNLGSFYDMIGRLEDAERSYAEALKHWQGLLDRRPDNSELLEHLAQLHQSLAFVHDKRGHAERAAESNAEALRLREQLVRRDPNHMTWLSQLADIQQNIAERHRRQGRLAEAEEWMEKYRPVREQLALHDPANAVWQHRLGEAWQNYALLLAAKADDAGAAEARLRAREALELALRGRPASAEWRTNWLEGLRAEEEIHLRLAGGARAKGDAEAARHHLQTADQLREKWQNSLATNEVLFSE